MVNWIKPTLFLTLIFAQDAVLAAKAFPRGYKRFTNYALREASKAKADGKSYINIVQGLLRSKKGDALRYISDIPCDVIQSLETDADEAMEFVEQLKAGQVPSVVQDLPQEAVQEFRDVINIALSLPTEILDAAEAAASDAANVFDDIEDGSIIQDIEQIPGVVLSDITNGWADFTNELTDAWNDVTSDIGCFFGDCPQPTTVGSCPGAAAATTTGNGAAATTTSYGAAATTTSNGAAASTTSNGAAATSPNAAQSTSTTPSAAQPTGAASLASSQSKWAGLGVLVAIAVGILACAHYI